MRIVRVQCGTECFYARLDGEVLYRLVGDPFEQAVEDGRTYMQGEVRMLPPCCPTKIVAVGKNYHEHALEMQEGEPDEPLLFLKPNTCVVGNGDKVYYPKLSHRLDFEGELGVVIGKSCRFAEQSKAFDFVFGYTCLNDVTARDIQKSDPQWTRGKSFDTFCPIGPWIETQLDPMDLKLETRLNGELRQSSSTADMTHGIAKLISYISQVMTLLPGDIIATGTPKGIGSMNVGDTVTVEIEGIGVLKNTIADESEIM